MRRPGGSARRWVALVPLGIAVIAAVALEATGGPVLVVDGPLAASVLGLGVVAAAVVAGVMEAAHRVRAARDEGYALAATDARADRRRWLLRLDHEFGNPLTAMRAGLANLSAHLDGADPSAPQARALASLEAQTVRVGRVVARLRELAELETREVERMPVDLGEVLAEVEDAIRELDGGPAREVRLSLPQAPWPLPAVSGDRDLLFLAVFNLAANSVKYSGDGDTLELRAFEDADGVVVEVADTGAGIARDEQEQVWEELARGRGARSVPGAGLGLPLVRTIVDRHGGDVSLRSREGSGTVVTMRLPVSPAAG